MYYNEYLQWHRRHQLQRRCKLPSQWYKFSSRLMRLFKRMLGKVPSDLVDDVVAFSLDPDSLKRCEITEIGKYYDDRWLHDINHRRRSSNEDEGVEEDFSSSGSGVESNPLTTSSTSNTDFEELTQMMRNSLITFDNLRSIPSPSASATRNPSQ